MGRFHGNTICWSITKAGLLENILFFLFCPWELNFVVLSRKASFYTWLHFRPPLWAGWKCGSKNDSSPDSLVKLLFLGASWTQMIFEMTTSIGLTKLDWKFPSSHWHFLQFRKQHTVLGRILRFCSLVWLSNDVTKKMYTRKAHFSKMYLMVKRQVVFHFHISFWLIFIAFRCFMWPQKERYSLKAKSSLFSEQERNNFLHEWLKSKKTYFSFYDDTDPEWEREKT